MQAARIEQSCPISIGQSSALSLSVNQKPPSCVIMGFSTSSYSPHAEYTAFRKERQRRATNPDVLQQLLTNPTARNLEEAAKG